MAAVPFIVSSLPRGMTQCISLCLGTASSKSCHFTERQTFPLHGFHKASAFCIITSRWRHWYSCRNKGKTQKHTLFFFENTNQNCHNSVKYIEISYTIKNISLFGGQYGQQFLCFLSKYVLSCPKWQLKRNTWGKNSCVAQPPRGRLNFSAWEEEVLSTEMWEYWQVWSRW